MPKTAEGWLRFTLAVFVAGVIINSLAKRVPALSQIASGV